MSRLFESRPLYFRAFLAALAMGAPSPASARARAPLNVVVIITDDQRWDTMWAMPITRRLISEPGTSFNNAIVTIPSCCPDRASLLSGGFLPYDTQVLGNSPPNGGFWEFNDRRTLATLLSERGYRTGLIGKYLNGYENLQVGPYIPPGWSAWYASLPDANTWTDYRVSEGTNPRPDAPGTGAIRRETQYLTDYERDRVVAFIAEPSTAPFFVWFAPHAPHRPAIPAPQDEGVFSDFTWGPAEGVRLWTPPTFVDEPGFDPARAGIELIRNQLRSLQSVDRAVGAIVEAVSRRGALDSTVFIFTSDNGFMWGEHDSFGKHKPWEESIRVPLALRWPGAAPAVREELVVTNLDVAATILDIAGAKSGGDGKSLAPLVRKARPSFRKWALISCVEVLQWAGLRTTSEKYLEYPDGRRALYDLAADPHERNDLSSTPRGRARMRGLSRKLRAVRGLEIIGSPPDGAAGTPYEHRLEATGARGPYRWSVERGRLPEGIALDPDGLLHGTTAERGSARFLLKVESPVRARQKERSQWYFRWTDFKVQ